MLEPTNEDLLNKSCQELSILCICKRYVYFGFILQLHFIAYNAEIYANYTIASGSPRGLAVVAVFLTVSFLSLFYLIQKYVFIFKI